MSPVKLRAKKAPEPDERHVFHFPLLVVSSSGHCKRVQTYSIGGNKTFLLQREFTEPNSVPTLRSESRVSGECVVKGFFVKP